MGSENSKVVRGGSKMSRSNNEMVKYEGRAQLKNCKEQMQVLQEQVANDVNHNPEECKKLLVVIDKARTQLERQDKALTKNDYILLLVKLGKIKMSEMEIIEKTCTISDLIVMIRGDIYDVRNFLGNGSGGTPLIQNDAPRALENGGSQLVVKKPIVI